MNRQKIIKNIQKTIEPFLWESGFVEESFKTLRDGTPSKPLKLYAFKKPRKIKGGYVLKVVGGFTKNGVITDGFGHGIVITALSELPIEDLEKLQLLLPPNLPRSI